MYYQLNEIKGRIRLNILILGATGRVGSWIVEFALRDEHEVTVLVRDPEKVQKRDDKLTVIRGNVLNNEDIERAMDGVDVVVSALGTDGGTTLTESMPYMIEMMERQGIKRIITVGTAGILQSRTNPELLRYESSESKRKLTRAAKEHHQVYEMLKESTLDWTIICPTYLPDGAQLGNYRVERDYLPVDGKQINVPDTAEFTYKQIDCKEYVRARVGIAY